MKCTITDIVKENILSDSNRFVEKPKGVFIPDSYYEHHYRIAEERAAAMNKLFEADTFGPIASIDNTFTDGTLVNIHPNSKHQYAKIVQDRRDNIKNNKIERYTPEFYNYDFALLEQEKKESERYEEEERYERDKRKSRKINEENNQYSDEIDNEDSLLYAIGKNSEKEESSVGKEIINLSDWIDIRAKRIEELEELAKSFYQNKEIRKLKAVNKLIDELETQLNSIDNKDPNTVYESTISEIKIMEDIIKNLGSKDNHLQDIIALDALKLKDRINDLLFYFNAYDTTTGETYRKSDEYKNTFHFNFSEGLDKDKSNVLQNRITQLEQDFRVKQETLINSLLDNDAHVQQHLKTGKFTLKDILYIKKVIRDRDFNVDSAAKEFLGASSNSVISQILVNIRDTNIAKEQGHTKELLTKLEEAWREIKDITTVVDGKKEFLSDKLFQKDTFGQINRNFLVGRYTKDFFVSLKNINIYKRSYYSNRNQATYGHWMNSEKNNFHKINPLLLPNIINKYKNKKEFKEYFDYTEKEIEEYQNYLKKLLGETYYEIEVKKAEKEIERFFDDIDTESLTSKQKYSRNPFRFIKHYNSDSYKQSDKKSGWFLEPNYISNIPNEEKDSFYNFKFDLLEKSREGKKLIEFYKIAHTLQTEFNNPTYRAENHNNVTAMTLPQFEDILNRTIVDNLKITGKVSKTLYKLRTDYQGKFYSPAIEKQVQHTLRNKNKNEKDREKLDKIQTASITYGVTQRDRIRDILEDYTMKELIKMAEERNINLKEIKKLIVGNKIKISKYLKRDLATSIATSIINEVVSENIFESIKRHTEMSNEIRANRKTITFLDTITSFAKSEDINLNTQKQIKTFAEENIYKYKYSRDYYKNIPRVFKNFQNTSLFGLGKTRRLRHLSEADKKLRKFLKNELKRNDVENFKFNFVLNGITYTSRIDKKDGQKRFYQKKEGSKEKEISTDNIIKKHKKYIKERIQDLGLPLRVGSALIGVMSMMILQHLGISPRSGLRNRLQGMIQNDILAASGKFGFEEGELYGARKFLVGTNFRSYFGKRKFKKTKKGKNVATLKQIIDKFNLSQNRADELAIESKFKGTQNKNFNKFKDFFMDFAINKPEWKNQTEVILSLFQKTMVETTTKGVFKPLFDAKTGDFIFIPGTLKLKPEFDTPKNRLLWEKFEIAEDGDTQSLVLISKVKNVIKKSQGNYMTDDIINAQSSLYGKLLTVYQRYLYENTNQQYGEQKIDLINGIINSKGRKIELFEHSPILAAHMSALNFSKIAKWFAAGASISISIAGISLFGTILPLISAASFVALLVVKRKLLISGLKNRKMKEFDLLLSYAKETAYRVIKTPIVKTTYGGFKLLGKTYNTHKLFNEKLKKLEDNDVNNRSIKRSDRKLLSENAQELALHISINFTYAAAALTLKVIYLALMGRPPDDEDDESKTKRLIRRIVDIEGVLRALTNDTNTVISELTKFMNPNAYKDEAGAFAFLGQIARVDTWFARFRKVVTGEKKVDRKFTYQTLTALPIHGIPNQASKLVSPDVGPFSDGHIYQGKGLFTDDIFRGLQSEKKEYTRLNQEKRKELSIFLYDNKERKARDVYREELKSGQMTKKEVAEEVKKIVEKELKRTYKQRDTDKYIYTQKELYNSIIWDEVRNDNTYK